MTVRLATADDMPRIEGFLKARAETSMFLRSNLAAHGLGPGPHPHATTIWLLEEGATLRGVFGASTSDFLMIQAPDVLHSDLACWCAALAGREIQGITGEAGQVAAAVAAFGWPEDAFSLNHAEPLYRLDLANLAAPDIVLRRARDADLDRLAEWFTAYLVETGTANDGPGVAVQARDRAKAACAPESLVRVMEDDGQPVAMAALNAQVDGMVQVGGVFVPPEGRNRGLARAVTTALLVEARGNGADTAVLFANNAAAARAYEAIGFQQVGSYGVALLKTPAIVPLVEDEVTP